MTWDEYVTKSVAADPHGISEESREVDGVLYTGYGAAKKVARKYGFQLPPRLESQYIAEAAQREKQAELKAAALAAGEPWPPVVVPPTPAQIKADIKERFKRPVSYRPGRTYFNEKVGKLIYNKVDENMADLTLGNCEGYFVEVNTRKGKTIVYYEPKTTGKIKAWLNLWRARYLGVKPK